MTAPSLTGRIGQAGSQPGLLQMGGARGPLFPTVQAPTIPATATPLIAHVFNNAMTTYKGSLTLLNRPKLKWSLNGGYDSITLLTQTPVTSSLYGVPTYGGPTYGGVSLGDVIQVSEQGGAGIIYTGILEQTTDVYDNPASFGLVLTPLVSELGDTGFSTNYVTPTDIADMVRDAVASTLHLKYNNFTIPDTGQLGQYDFSSTNCLDVLNVARLMAGVNYYWFADAAGYVWFQFQGAGAQHTLTQLQQYTSRTKTPDITKLKNDFLVIGGIPSGSTAPITSTYLSSSTATYGPRTIMPPPTFPTVTDQTSLDLLANTIGGVLDRVLNRTDMTVTNYTTPIVPDRPGGPMLRYWEPAKYPLQEQAQGVGNYSSTYIVLENERDGPIQKIKAGDIPINTVDDLKYMVDRIVMRLAVQPNAAPIVQQGGVAASLTVQNATGTNLLDGVGIVSTSMLSLVLQMNGLAGTSSTATYNPIGPTGVLDVPRTQSFIALASIRCASDGTSLPSCSWRLSVAGQLSEQAVMDAGIGLPTNNNFTLFVSALNLSSGVHPVQIECASFSGTATLVDGTINVFLLGS